MKLSTVKMSSSFLVSVVVVLCTLDKSYSKLCVLDADFTGSELHSNWSLIFEAQALGGRNDRRTTNTSLLHVKVLNVFHSSNNVGLKADSIRLRDRATENPVTNCGQIKTEASYLIFVTDFHVNSTSTVISSKMRPLTVTPQLIVQSTKSRITDVARYFCAGCRKPSKVRLSKPKVEVRETDPINFFCEVPNAKPQPAIEWVKGGTVVNSTSHVKISRKKNRLQLKINKAAVNDAGDYYCHASNIMGEHRSERLNVIVAAAACTKGSSTCGDQTHCWHNGTCCIDRMSKMYCICTEQFTGDRCEKYFLAEEVKASSEKSETYASFGSEVVVIIVAIASLLIVSLMIVIAVLGLRICQHRTQVMQGNASRFRQSSHGHRDNRPMCVSASCEPFILHSPVTDTRVLEAAAATKRRAAAGAINQNDPIDKRPPNTCAPTEEGPEYDEKEFRALHVLVLEVCEKPSSMGGFSSASVYPVQAVVEEESKWEANAGQELQACATVVDNRDNNDVDGISVRHSIDSVSTQSLNNFKWELSSDNYDIDDDVKANRASAANVLDIDDDRDDRYMTSPSFAGDTSAFSSQYGGDTTPYTFDGDSDNDNNASNGAGLLQKLYAAYTIGEDSSLDEFAAGGNLPSLKDYIGAADDSDSVRQDQSITTELPVNLSDD